MRKNCATFLERCFVGISALNCWTEVCLHYGNTSLHNDHTEMHNGDTATHGVSNPQSKTRRVKDSSNCDKRHLH